MNKREGWRGAGRGEERRGVDVYHMLHAAQTQQRLGVRWRRMEEEQEEQGGSEKQRRQERSFVC